MKTKLYSILIITVIVFGCDSELDIQPRQSISSDIALGSSSNVINALIGAYGRFGGQLDNNRVPAEGGELYGGDFLLLSDLIGDNGEADWTGSFEEQRDAWNKAMFIENIVVRNNWNVAYDAINIVNNVINVIDIVDSDVRDQILGEALFIRGAIYFDLARFFALPWVAGGSNTQPGVPLVLTPTEEITEANNVARASVAEVYTQAIDDLTRAEGLLPATNGNRASSITASAFLARVYFQQGDYANAADKANTVISSGQFSLLASYGDNFNQPSNTAEVVFAIQQSAQVGDNAGEGNGGMSAFFADLPGNIGRGDVDIQQAHLDLYDLADERGTFSNFAGVDPSTLNIQNLGVMFYTQIGDNKPNQVRSAKWGDFTANTVIIRLAEMILTRGESNLRAGTVFGGVTPLQDINTIRNRAGLPSLTSVATDDFFNERHLELAFEGHLLHDLKRVRRNVGTFAYDAGNLIFPIPSREIDVNPNLEQNDFYK